MKYKKSIKERKKFNKKERINLAGIIWLGGRNKNKKETRKH